MDHSGFLGNKQEAAALIFHFLQADCTDSVYIKELSTAKYLNGIWDGHSTDCLLDEGLQCDGGIQSNSSLDDFRPQVDLQWLDGPADAADIHAVAAGLRDIAAQFEDNIVARATRNLSRDIRTSPSEEWKHHLSHEVEQVMKQSVVLANLSQERVMVALALTVVKGVCKQTPRLLRDLFETALHFIYRPASR